MDEPSPKACLNCGAPLTGRYCAECGQKDEHRILPLRHLLHEVFHDLAHLDARFLKSLWMLAKPGALTLEYLAGRRARWFPPFRLYLMVSLAFFALAALGPKTQNFHITTRGNPAVVGLDGRVVQPTPGPALSHLERRAAEVNRDPGPFLTRLNAWIPRVLFLLLPFFALLLKLAYLRSGTLYAVHAIFSLHAHAFVFLLFSVVNLLGHVPYLRGVRGWLFVALPVHLLLSMKRVYGQGWALTLAKAGTVGVLHLLAGVAALALTALGLLWFG